MYPTVYCTAEQLYIGFSTRTLPMHMKSVPRPDGTSVRTIQYKKRMTPDYFAEWCMNWRSPEYRIDMSKFKTGDLIRCPKCKCQVDFRAFPSNKTPEFTEDKKDEDIKKGDADEFPSAQA